MRSKIFALLATIIIIANIVLLATDFGYKVSGFNLFLLSLNVAAYGLTVLIYRELMISQKKKEILEISEKLSKSRDRYKLFLDKISEGVVLVIGQDNNCRYVNNAFLILTELEEGDIVGESISSIFSSDIPRLSTNAKTQIHTKSGKIIDVIISSMPVLVQEEQETLISITDITEFRKLEEALKDSEQKAYAAFDSSDAAVIIVNQKTHTIYKLNDAACKLTGFKRSEIEGKICDHTICRYSNEKCLQRLDEVNSFVKEEQLVRKNGTKIPVLKSISRISIDKQIYIVETIIDISTRKKFEEAIFRNQKLESIGTLASGVAHEFNNINAIIKGIIEMIFINDVNNDIPTNIKKQLKTVQKMIERSSTLTTDLLVFSNDSQNGYDIFRPIDLVDEIIETIQSDLEKYHIEIDIKIPQGTCVYANPDKIRSVFTNLISNAWHSMAESKERKLSLICSEIDDYVEFIVKDSGCGISEEELPKIFDPFFSNKGIYASPGSAQSNFDAKGLGLSICQTIMENHHNGKIEISSKINEKTVIKLHIPKAIDFHFKEDALPQGKSRLIAIFDQYLKIDGICKKIFDLCDFITISVQSEEELIGLVGNVDLIVIDKESIYQEEIFECLTSQNKKTPVILLDDQNDSQLPHKKDLGIKNICCRPYYFRSMAWNIDDILS